MFISFLFVFFLLRCYFFVCFPAAFVPINVFIIVTNFITKFYLHVTALIKDLMPDKKTYKQRLLVCIISVTVDVHKQCDCYKQRRNTYKTS